MDISKIQFSQGTGKVIPYCPTAKVGILASAAAQKCNKHTGKTPPKVSGAAVVIAQLLAKNVSAIVVNHSDIYCEIKHDKSAGFTSSSFCLTDGCLYRTSKNYAPYDDVIPFVLYALDKEHFPETSESFTALKKIIETAGTVETDDVAYACDCFYYEAKEAWRNEFEKKDDSTRSDLIQLSINAGNFRPLETDFEIGQDFTQISIPAKSPVTKPTAPKDGTFFDNCKASEYELGWEWDPENQKRIPDATFLNEFVPNETHRIMTLVAHRRLSSVIGRLNGGLSGTDAIKGDYMNAILVGKPGTGKTTTAKALAATLGVPLYTVPLSKYTEEDEFEGKTKAAEGGFKFFPTAFLQAYKSGGIAVLEEFNLADPAVMQGAIGQAIEAPFIMMENGHVEVKRHPLFVAVMTMNTATQGSREPNEAFTSRAPLTIIMDDPSQDEFVKILVNKGNSKKDSEKVYSTYTKILTFLKNESAGEDIMASLTIRHCIEALYLMSIGFDFKPAVKNTLVGTLAIKDLELSKQVYEAVVETMKD
jgi:hypothetical protein